MRDGGRYTLGPEPLHPAIVSLYTLPDRPTTPLRPATVQPPIAPECFSGQGRTGPEVAPFEGASPQDGPLCSTIHDSTRISFRSPRTLFPKTEISMIRSPEMTCSQFRIFHPKFTFTSTARNHERVEVVGSSSPPGRKLCLLTLCGDFQDRTQQAAQCRHSFEPEPSLSLSKSGTRDETQVYWSTNLPVLPIFMCS
jgi:hypothetical protein